MDLSLIDAQGLAIKKEGAYYKWILSDILV